MSRKVVLPLSFLCLALVGTTACTGGPYDVVGDWTLTIGGSSGPGLISSAGLAVFFQTSPSLVVVTLPAITGTCSFSGTATAYSIGQTGTSTVQGNVNSATSISGKITNNGDTFSIVPNTPLTGSVTALSGTGWEGELQGSGLGIFPSLTFTATGTGGSQSMSVAETAGAGCNVSGTFNQETGNVFDVSLALSGDSCSVSSITGLGFESSSDYLNVNGGAAGTYLYAVSSSSDLVLEVFKPATR